MNAEPLCFRTFCEVIRLRMNKKSRTKFFMADASGQGFDGTRDKNLYPLLLEAVVYIAKSNDEPDLPDVSAKMVSELKNGSTEVHPKIIEVAQRKRAVKAVGEYLAADLIPNMTQTALAVALDGVGALVAGDALLGTALKKTLANARKNKTPADYLAEVLISAITLGKNKIEAQPKEVSALDAIRSNSHVWFEDYKRNNAISVDSAILPEIHFESGGVLSLSDVLRKRESASLILLLGEGGIGKSYALFDCCTKLLDDKAKAFLPLYIPMRELSRTEKSPILQYAFDKFFTRLDWNRDPDSLKRHLRDSLFESKVQLVFLLDGFNEYAFDAKDDEYKILVEEIRWLKELKNVRVILSSRSNREFDTDVVGCVKRLDENRVIEYLKAHENTNRIDISALSNNRIVELLQTPLMLALFTKTYSPVYTTLNTASVESVSKHSDVLALCVEYQKNRLRKTSRANYAFDILLPMITVDADFKMSFDALDLAEQAQLETRITLSESFKRLWFRRKDCKRDEIEALSSDEIKLFNELISATILDNAVFLVESNDKVSWQHELLMNWFAAKGVVFNLDYQRENAIEKIESIASGISASDNKSDSLIPVALFLSEMLEDTKESDTVHFVRLITGLARWYHYAKEYSNIDRFATLALRKIEEGSVNELPLWQSAEMMNNNAYMRLTVKRENVGKDVDYRSFLDTSKDYLDRALSIIESTDFDAENDHRIRLIEAQIYGNMGAYQIAKFRDTDDVSCVDEALRNHQKGLELRRLLFEKYPDAFDSNHHYGMSYHALATDYFYLGEYEKSLEYHREAINFREKVQGADMNKVVSYSWCIGSLIKLLESGRCGLADCLDEIRSLYKRILGYPKCLLKNRKELDSIGTGLKGAVRLTDGFSVRVDDTFLSDMTEAARKIDALYAELSVESDLQLQIIKPTANGR
jgi:hypothetical protein